MRRHGCDLAQGFLFSPPLPANDVPTWLQAWHREHEIELLPVRVAGHRDVTEAQRRGGARTAPPRGARRPRSPARAPRPTPVARPAAAGENLMA